MQVLFIKNTYNEECLYKNNYNTHILYSFTYIGTLLTDADLNNYQILLISTNY